MRLWAPKSIVRFSRAFGLRALALACVFSMIAYHAHAADPFEMEGSSWMSFDRYKEQPANWVAPDQRAQAAMQPVIVPPPITPADMPVITSPTRAIATPALPGVNKDFDVRVDSTEDDGLKRAATIANLDGEPDIDLQSSWQDAAKAARANQDKTQMLEEENKTYQVRYSYLPALITPMKKAPKPPKVEVAQPKMSEPIAPISKSASASTPAQVTAPAAVATAEKTKTAAAPRAETCGTTAATAAVDAYKKRQLAAIESDRQTLAALQNAITQLGLNKQLDFMVGANGTVGVQPTNLQQDTPAQPAKNP